MVIESSNIIAILLALCLSETTRAAISPPDETYTASVGTDLTIPWSFDNETNIDTVYWSHKTTGTPTTVMSKTGANAAVVFNKFNIEHVSNGEIKLKSVTMDNAGIYYCEVSYVIGTGLPTVTGTATISIEGTIPPSTTPAPTAPTTTPSTTTKSPDKKITVYIIVACVGVVAFVVLSILACYLLRKRNNRKKKNGAVPELDTKDVYSLGSKM